MLNMDYDYYVHDDCLEVQISGNFQLYEAIEKFELLLGFCRNNNIAKVILDHRNLTIPPENTLKCLYEFGIENEYRKHRIVNEKNILFAYIHKTVPDVQHIPRYTDYFFNMKSRSFDNLREALNWLEVYHQDNNAL